MKAISKPKSLGSRGFAPTQTRLDQPGLTVYPHQENRDDNDGLAYPICFGKKFEDTRYYQDLQTFLKAKSYKSLLKNFIMLNQLKIYNFLKNIFMKTSMVSNLQMSKNTSMNGRLSLKKAMTTERSQFFLHFQDF